MKLASINKTSVLRAFACVLLLVSLALTLAQETNSFSERKVFVKAHSPTSDNFIFSFSADDIEDADEDAAVDVQNSHSLLVDTFSFPLLRNQSITFGKPQITHISDKAFLRFGQLLI